MRHSSGFMDDSRLDSPIGITAEQRHRARLVCAERVPRQHLVTVLMALGLIPYREGEA